MNYFITSREDIKTSAIELAQVKRLQIFDYLHQPAKIVTMYYNFAHLDAENKLGTSGRVINLFQFYQRLPYHMDPGFDQSLIKQILNVPGYQVKGNQAERNGKVRIKVNQDNNRLYYVDYLDQYGFTDRRDYYDCGCKTYTEFFEDRARLVCRQYYDQSGAVKITYHYRGGQGNIPVLTLIQLVDQNQELQFDNQNEFRAYFLDQLVANDPDALLINDRSDVTLAAFRLMHTSPRRYQVFHSAFTQDGQSNSEISPIYQPINEMLNQGQLTGLISSTKREAMDASRRFNTNMSFAIPVTFLSQTQLEKSIPSTQRQVGHFIAVARLTKVKQLDQLINVIIRLHEDFPKVQLDIYGYSDGWNNYQTVNELKKIINNQGADHYIHFCGYQHDLTRVYETAQAEILTSQYEGFAMALLEAQGHGCPAISYDINYGPTEIIDNNISGELIPANDCDALYQSLRQLLVDPKLFHRYTQNAQHAAAKFSLNEVAKKWQDFLKKA